MMSPAASGRALSTVNHAVPFTHSLDPTNLNDCVRDNSTVRRLPTVLCSATPRTPGGELRGPLAPALPLGYIPFCELVALGFVGAGT